MGECSNVGVEVAEVRGKGADWTHWGGEETAEAARARGRVGLRRRCRIAPRAGGVSGLACQVVAGVWDGNVSNRLARETSGCCGLGEVSKALRAAGS